MSGCRPYEWQITYDSKSHHSGKFMKGRMDKDSCTVNMNILTPIKEHREASVHMLEMLDHSHVL